MTIASAQNGVWQTGATWVGGVKPGAGDDAQIEHAVVVDSVEAAAGVSTTATGTLTIDAGQSLDVGAGGLGSGSGGILNIAGVLYCAGTLDLTAITVNIRTGSIVFDTAAGAVSLFSAGNTLPAMTVNNAGVTSFTLADALTVGGALTLTAGALATGANTWSCNDFALSAAAFTGSGAGTVTGDITVTGAYAHTGIITLATGADASHTVVANAYDRVFKLVVPAGQTMVHGAMWLRGLQLAGTDSSTGAITAYPAGASGVAVADVLNCTGGAVLNSSVTVLCSNEGTIGLGTVNLAASKTLKIAEAAAANATQVATCSGLSMTATLTISRARSVAQTLTLTMQGSITGSPTVVLSEAAGEHGAIDLGSYSHALGNMSVGAGTAAGSGIAFSASTVTLAADKTIDGANGTCTNTSGVVVGGTVTNVNISSGANLLHLLPVDDNSTNTNVTVIAALAGGVLYTDIGIAA